MPSGAVQQSVQVSVSASKILSPPLTAVPKPSAVIAGSDPAATKPAPAIPSPSEAPAWLRASQWQLRYSHGQVIIETLIFLSDGLVWDGAQVIWRWQYDKTSLAIFHLDGTKFIEFIRRKTADQPIALDGKMLPATANGPELVLSPAPEAAPLNDPNRDFNASVVLGNQSKTLLVIFNSAHRPYEGREYGPQWRWEFYELPEKIGVDHVRLAEGNQPLHWYTNKTKHILALLEGIIKTGYKQVVLCGMSSGGYASLWFAETLSRIFPGVMFRTSTINPQTGHAAEHRKFLEPMDVFRPALIANEALQQRDCEETEIATLAAARAKAKKTNISHTIYYDGSNQAEVYYVNLVAHFPGFTLKPEMFGVGHMSGCIAFYERRLVHIEVEAACRAWAGQQHHETRRP
jgi:predicted esterase YcpF (UPF0227 family)